MEKICGNCGHCADRHGHYNTNDGVCLRIGVSVRKDNKDAYTIPCGFDLKDEHKSPAQWIERTDSSDGQNHRETSHETSSAPDMSPERRHAQLEQVAKTMYKSLRQIQEGKLPTSIEFCVDACKYGLKACGVSLDD